jgi:hypothetical protein
VHTVEMKEIERDYQVWNSFLEITQNWNLKDFEVNLIIDEWFGRWLCPTGLIILSC